MLVDAEDGRLLFRHNLYQWARARVWKESPLKGTNCPVASPCAREVVTLPAAWLPAAATVTTGNNVDAFVDANADGIPDALAGADTLNGRPNSPTQEFDFPAPDGPTPQDPTGFKAAGATNLFYFVNLAHDYFYGLGFNEAAGNFQSDNFGLGGLGGDPILAAAQYGSSQGAGNNSSFAPTPDGMPARLRIYIFTKGSFRASTNRDGDYDGQVVLHEYAHGVSTRLVGGRTDTSCLNGRQSGALGEGWSDYFAISFYNNPVMGAYSWLDSTNGLRRRAYDSQSFTYEDLGNAGFEVHNDGEIWAATLWDLRTSLGQLVADRLVINALKATPCKPSMTDARDAILAADQATRGGANRANIWQVFARHGLGYSAGGVDGSVLVGTVFTASYDQPPDLQPGNRYPAITSRPPVAPGLGDLYAYNILASDPEGRPLQFDFAALRSGEVTRAKPMDMTLDNGNGQIRWTATFLSQRVKITVTDAQGAMVVHGFELVVNTILSAGVPLVISSPAGFTGTASFTVGPDAPLLQVTTRGAGDADIYVFDPDGMLAGYSLGSTSNETVSTPLPKVGRWTIRVLGFEGFRDVNLMAALPVPRLLPGNSSLVLSDDVATFRRKNEPPGTMFTEVGVGR